MEIKQPCMNCGLLKTKNAFIPTNSHFMPNGHFPLCNDCLIADFGKTEEYKKWDYVNKLCQCANFPFLPDKWTELYKTFGDMAIVRYGLMFNKDEYCGDIDWEKTNGEWLRLDKEGKLKECCSDLTKADLIELSNKWQGDYTREELDYLEQTLDNLNHSFSITSGLMKDQAMKLCKISLLIDQKIRVGDDFDKLLKSYDTIIKIGGFNSENSKNDSDFESVGELFAFLEKKGYMNRFYDGVSRDVVDETMKNITANNRRWILNEANIQEQANKKLEALRLSELQEKAVDYDIYDNASYDVEKQLDEMRSKETEVVDEVEYDEQEEFLP